MRRQCENCGNYLNETDKYTGFFIELNGMVHRRETVEEQFVSDMNLCQV